MCNPKSLFAVLLAGVAVLAGGCDTFFGDGYEVRMTTDEPQYTAELSTTISVTVENRSDNAVYYSCAGDVVIERYVDGELLDYFGLGNCQCICPTPIEPGATQDREFPIDERVIEWLNDGTNLEETRYRYRLVLFEDAEFEKELDFDDQHSNEFTIVLPTSD